MQYMLFDAGGINLWSLVKATLEKAKGLALLLTQSLLLQKCSYLFFP